MKHVSHRNPYTGESAGHLFSRGPIVVADGGEANAVGDEESEDDERTMKTVSHTPPKDADSANAVFERGTQKDQPPAEDADVKNE